MGIVDIVAERAIVLLYVSIKTPISDGTLEHYGNFSGAINLPF